MYIALAINDGFKTKQEKKPTHSQNIVHTHSYMVHYGSTFPFGAQALSPPDLQTQRPLMANLGVS